MARGGDAGFPAPDMARDLTIPRLFLQVAQRYGDQKVAMREKEYGIWRPITWRQYLEHVRELVLGFMALGLQRGDKVALMGANRPEGLWAEMATLCAGGVTVWLFQDCMLDEVQYIVDHSDARFLVAEGQEEVDKGLAIKDRCPKLERIIWDDPKGMRRYRDPCLISFQDAERLGRDLAVPDDQDRADVLLRYEHRAVRREGHVHREAQASHDGLEPLLGARRRREEEEEEHGQRAEASTHRHRV